MADPEIQFQNCPMPEAGCFAADPEAYKALSHPDPGISATYASVARSARAAGGAEIGVDNIIYTQARCELERQIDGLRAVTILPELTPARVTEPTAASGEFEKMTWRVANAAYNCGACPDCPLHNKTPKTATEEFVGLSSLANHVQRVGDHILDAKCLDEIREGLYSNCPDADLEQVERLVWAHEESVPLLEVSVLPVIENKNVFRRLFGPGSRLIHGIFRSEATEDYNVRYERVGVIVPEIDTDENSHGPLGRRIAAAELELGWHQGYQDGAPLGSKALMYEGGPTNPAHYIQVVLNNALHDLVRLGA